MREGELLSHIFASNASLPADVLIRPGDDMGMLRIGDERVLVTVDQLIDGVHFRLDSTSLDLIGRKAVTRNLSDVAAMAAWPIGAVAAGALPKTFGKERSDTLFDAMRVTAEHYECPLVGGDIAIHDGPLILTVTVLASPKGVEPVRRDNARDGDLIGVTGSLGGAWSVDGRATGHLTFEPRIGVARKLAENLGCGLHSMIDISDGLTSDLGHICQASGVGGTLDAKLIPLRGSASLENALNNGEDYELLFTFDETVSGRLPEAVDGVPITVIGRIVAGQGINLVGDGGRIESLKPHGYEHKA